MDDKRFWVFLFSIILIFYGAYLFIVDGWIIEEEMVLGIVTREEGYNWSALICLIVGIDLLVILLGLVWKNENYC